jgi:hypothetical protein
VRAAGRQAVPGEPWGVSPRVAVPGEPRGVSPRVDTRKESREAGCKVEIRQCRGCGAEHLTPVLDLGAMPLAHRFVAPRNPQPHEPIFPLRLAFCRHCGLAQLADEMPADLPGEADPSDSVRRFSGPRAWSRKYALDPSDLLVELINDSASTAQHQLVTSLGLPQRLTVARWTESAAGEVRRTYGPARVLSAARVLAHSSDLPSCLRGLRRAVDDDGLVVVETPYLAALVEGTAFDMVQHRHLQYFSLYSLQKLLSAADLCIFDLEPRPLAEGWLVVYAAPTHRAASPSRHVAAAVHAESCLRLGDPATWQALAARIERAKTELWVFLNEAFRFGQTFAGYGASARGNTLLSYCGVTPEHLPYIVDANVELHGLLTPGHHIPITSPERLLADLPDITLVLSWNEADAIIREQLEYRRRGGRLASALPEMRIISVAA